MSKETYTYVKKDVYNAPFQIDGRRQFRPILPGRGEYDTEVQHICQMRRIHIKCRQTIRPPLGVESMTLRCNTLVKGSSIHIKCLLTIYPPGCGEHDTEAQRICKKRPIHIKCQLKIDKCLCVVVFDRSSTGVASTTLQCSTYHNRDQYTSEDTHNKRLPGYLDVFGVAQVRTPSSLRSSFSLSRTFSLSFFLSHRCNWRS